MTGADGGHRPHPLRPSDTDMTGPAPPDLPRTLRYAVVRDAVNAYLAGDPARIHLPVEDTLRLLRKVGDKVRPGVYAVRHDRP
jgi:hypothetical protein